MAASRRRHRTSYGANKRPAIVDCVVAPHALPNFPHLDLDKIGHYAMAKIKETMLALTGR
jgi:hypothetical protein